jgi:hypothetical protein
MFGIDDPLVSGIERVVGSWIGRIHAALSRDQQCLDPYRCRTGPFSARKVVVERLLQLRMEASPSSGMRCERESAGTV